MKYVENSQISTEHDITRHTEIFSDVHREIMFILNASRTTELAEDWALLATRVSHCGVGDDDLDLDLV